MIGDTGGTFAARSKPRRTGFDLSLKAVLVFSAARKVGTQNHRLSEVQAAGHVP